MKWDGGTLRVICLVATAVSAGYLWRAALEGDPEFSRLLDTSAPVTARPGASPPVLAPRIHTAAPDRALAAERPGTKRAEPVRSKPAARGQKRAKSVLVVNRSARPKKALARAATPTRAGSSPNSSGTRTKRQPKLPKTSPGAAGKTSTPKAPRDPVAKPPTDQAPTPVTTGSSSGERSEPTTPSAQTPTTRSEKAPRPKAQKAPSAKPEKAPGPKPEETSAPTQAPLRPGWGHGDENHDHAGPSGQAKKGGPRK